MSYAVQVADGPNSALDDLTDLPRPLRRALADVMSTDLVHTLDPTDEDSGPIESTVDSAWRWRRGITRQDRQRSNHAAEEPTLDPQAVDFVIIYRSFKPHEVIQSGGVNGFYVWRVLPNACLGHMLIHGPS